MGKWSNTTRLFRCLQFRQVEYCDLFQYITIGTLTDYKPTDHLHKYHNVSYRHSLNFILLNYNQFYLNCSELLFLNWGYVYIVVYMQVLFPYSCHCHVQLSIQLSFMICWKVLQNAFSTHDQGRIKLLGALGHSFWWGPLIHVWNWHYHHIC